MRPVLLAALGSACLAWPLAADAPPPSKAYTAEERAALHAEIRGYLLDNPEILREMITLLEQSQAAEAAANDAALVAANADALFDDGYSHVAGNPDGDVTVVEFVDYQCGFCRRAHPEVKALIGTDDDIRLIVKELPILGPGSELAARAAIAVLMVEGPDAYSAVNDKLLLIEGQIDEANLAETLADEGLALADLRETMSGEEVTRRLRETRSLAQALEISGTPTFVFGDQMVRGYIPLPQMRRLVAELRADG